MDIEIAIVLLTEIRLEESKDLTAIDPKNQENVNRENTKAVEQFEDATNYLAIGKLDNGIREFAKVWQHAARAEEEALKLPATN